MKKPILLLFISTIFIFNVHSQADQFAVVKPNGSTQVYASWAAAYGGAANGDYMYLPGATISGTITIDKKLFIYGTGHDPDSATATGRTIFSSINILDGASGGSIEGIQAGAIYLGSANKLHDYAIKRSYILAYLQFTSTTYDSLPEYVTISESVVGWISNVFADDNISVSNCIFFKNIFTKYISRFKNSTFKNNVFIPYELPNNTYVCNYITFTLFENNIFTVANPTIYSDCNNIYLNNLKCENNIFYGDQNCPASQEGNLSEPSVGDIFISYTGTGFKYTDNYHLKPSCIGVGAGTDGTDVGIYGTINPTIEGWIPSNPHIYFKQVDPETGPDGKLHIQVGVRANNN